MQGKSITSAVLLCSFLALIHQARALGPPVEIQGTIELVGPSPRPLKVLNLPVDESIVYENTDRLVLDFDFTDMKHLEITGTDFVDLTVALLFDESDLRNRAADIQVHFGFSDMDGDLIGSLFNLPFATESGANQIGASTDIDDLFDPIPLPEQPLVFHDILIVVETSHPNGLFIENFFSFNDNGFSAASVIDPTGQGIIQVGEWIPEPTSAITLLLGLAAIGARCHLRVR